MSVEREEDGTVHLTADSIDTLILGLICLEVLWKEHPDVVRSICTAEGNPELIDQAPKARLLLAALVGLRNG